MAQSKAPILSTNWEVFVALVTLLSLFNIALRILPLDIESHNVVLAVDVLLTLVFLLDFFARLSRAESKRDYLIGGGGILDLVGSVPGPGLRLLRSYRLIVTVGTARSTGARPLLARADRKRAQGALLSVVLMVFLLLEFAGLAILQAERYAEGANIVTASDALWWGYVSITTVGYGDRFPVTDLGRGIGAILLTVGVALFASFTAYISDLVLGRRDRIRYRLENENGEEPEPES